VSAGAGGPLRPALTTGQIAALINEVIGHAVYDSRAIRAEIGAGRLRAFPVGRRRRPLVTESECLRWASQGVLYAPEVARLRLRIESMTTSAFDDSPSPSNESSVSSAVSTSSARGITR